MRLRLTFEYLGWPGDPSKMPGEHPGQFEKVVDRDYDRTPLVGEKVRLVGRDGPLATVNGVCWEQDGSATLWLESLEQGPGLTRSQLLTEGWQDLG